MTTDEHHRLWYAPRAHVIDAHPQEGGAMKLTEAEAERALFKVLVAYGEAMEAAKAAKAAKAALPMPAATDAGVLFRTRGIFSWFSVSVRKAATKTVRI